VTERGLPVADGASACPFVAFEDDRDERASVPDHRHRCYADTRPSPRALAHQEAYCLSSAFPVCPTFQDWARREAARARDAADAASASAAASQAGAAGGGDETGSAAGLGAAAGAAAAGEAAAGSAAARAVELVDDVDHDASEDAGPGSRSGKEALAEAGTASAAGSGDGHDADDEDRDGADADDFGARRNPPRDWAAPPPWLASDESRRSRSDADAPGFLSRRASDPGQGLAGSAADRLAGGSPVSSGTAGYGAAAGAAAAGLAASSPGASDHPDGQRGADRDGGHVDRTADDDQPRRTRRPRAYEQHLGGTDGPDWEQPRRYEAYPRIRTRVGLPNVPRLGVMAGAIAIAAIALFLLPFILGFGNSPGPAASLAPSVGAASPSVGITPVPAATPTLYTIKKGDTLLKIARANGISLDQLLHANPQIKNPNIVQLGQQIIIPTPGASGGGSPSRSP